MPEPHCGFAEKIVLLQGSVIVQGRHRDMAAAVEHDAVCPTVLAAYLVILS